MLSGRLLQRMSVLLTAMLMIASAGTACKKKSKKKGASQQVEETPNPDKKDVEFGKELIEGDTMVFRGADGEFFIQATPYKVSVGQLIRFEGHCGPSNNGTLSWDFGDTNKPKNPPTGAKAEYAYGTAGTYRVTGACSDGSAAQTGTLTITVMSSVISPLAPSVASQNGCTNPNSNCGRNGGGGIYNGGSGGGINHGTGGNFNPGYNY